MMVRTEAKGVAQRMERKGAVEKWLRIFKTRLVWWFTRQSAYIVSVRTRSDIQDSNTARVGQSVMSRREDRNPQSMVAN